MKEVHKRMASLADDGTLRVLEENQSAVAVAAAKIANKPVALAALDPAKKGGALGYLEGQSLLRGISLAKEAGAPFVLMCQSAGADMTGSQLSLSGAGAVFRALHALETPRIYLSYGPCIGAAAYMATLSDVVLAVRGMSAFCLTGPKIVARAIYEEAILDEIGGAEAVARRGGIHLLANTTEAMEENCRKIVGFVKEKHVRPKDPMGEKDIETMEGIIDGIVDKESATILWPRWAPHTIALFARLKGMGVGIFANNPRVAAGVLDRAAAEKAATFYRLCDRFHLPVISLADTPGFLPGSVSEEEGVLKGGAAMIGAYLNHRWKKSTVAVGRVLGGSYMAMGCKEMGADAYYALKDAQIGVTGEDMAAEILHLRGKNIEEYRSMHLSIEAAKAEGLVDHILSPDALRESLWEALS
ncbi:MAG: carboxyl transferase domain-containing protein [Peptoniphilus sp.]|nr:carboxyl transferase domain-containing protein [Peptoniphilus sp.]MDY3118530.1 carboxyl transferase domain-containing protein [Peptoniphilus sp.]